MDLALRGARADGAVGDEVGHVLRSDRIEEFGRGGEAGLGDLGEEAAGETQAFVDAERAIDLRVVDEPLPADRGPRLLEVDAHDHEELGGVLLRLLAKEGGIFQGGLRVMDGTGTDDHQQAVVLAGDDLRGVPAGVGHDLGGAVGDRQFGEHEGGSQQGELTADA